MSDCLDILAGQCLPIPQSAAYQPGGATATPSFSANGLTAGQIQSQDVLAVALTSMNAFTVVKIGSGGVQPVDPGTPADKAAVFGITLSSVAAGAQVYVRPFGVVFNNLSGAAGWNWTIGNPIYVGAQGLLQQSANTSGWNLIVGAAIAQSGITFDTPYSKPSPELPQTVAFTTATETLTADASLNDRFNVSLQATGATLNITNPTDGQTVEIEVQQDATGGRTITISPMSLTLQGGGTFAFTATANAVDLLTLRYNAARSKWYIMSAYNNAN